MKVYIVLSHLKNESRIDAVFDSENGAKQFVFKKLTALYPEIVDHEWVVCDDGRGIQVSIKNLGYLLSPPYRISEQEVKTTSK